MDTRPQPILQAFAALEPFPALHAAVAPALSRQTAQVATALARYQQRPRLIAALAATLADPRGGLVVLEGPPGSGVSSLIAALAAQLPLPLWLASTSGPAGLAALYAQLTALYRPTVPLLDPAAASDPVALDQLLVEAVSARDRVGQVLLAIDDLYPSGQAAYPGPTLLPCELPRGVTLLLGCTPGVTLPYAPLARIILPDHDAELVALQARTLTTLGCPPGWAEPVRAAAAGNLLYLRLALAMLRAGLIVPTELPQGLDNLLQAWWAGLPAVERRLAALLSAAAEPLPLSLATHLVGADLEPALAYWEQLGLLDLTVQAAPLSDDCGEASLRPPLLLGAFAHSALPALIGRIAAADLAAAHRDLATLALAAAETERAYRRPAVPTGQLDPNAGYLRRQLARHDALAPAEPRAAGLQRLISRDWLRDHARRDALTAALEEARWELRAAATGSDALRLVRAVALTGLLASRARTLAPEAAAEALLLGIEHGGREQALRYVQTLTERLPDGSEKAAVLKRIGEVCYGARMRSAAMRLLSRALDLEASPFSRAWRDSREALHTAFATAALALGAVDVALRIAERIEHLERRAMLETEVVRHLLQSGDQLRAQRLARAIMHETMGAWARAEVGVALVRTGDQRGMMLLDELDLETVAAWAQIELACDEVAYDEAAALRRVAALPSQGQRDRGLARLARALAAAGDEGAALAAAEAIVAVEVRVAALIDLRLSLEGLVAMLALERATRDIGALSGDDRVPLVAALAAALAALGGVERALALAESLPAGEERDRALARMAVALAQSGAHADAEAILLRVDDEDERDWAYDEFARLLAAAGRWAEATALVERIAADDQRARAGADLAIARARAGDAVAALALALAQDPPGERARALNAIGPALVAAGEASRAMVVATDPVALVGAEALGRYLAAVSVALVEYGHTEAAAAAVASIRHPGDRARAGAAFARTLATQRPELAQTILAATLRTAATGREEALRALELAAPALGLLGGADLLDAASASVDVIDRW